MTWHKRGLVLLPPRRAPWAVSHAALPVADASAERLQVYFSPRDNRGRAHIARAQLDLDAPHAGRAEAIEVLAPGAPGAFDEAGATVSCLVIAGDLQVLYYTGWTIPAERPFMLQVGSARSTDGGLTFHRTSTLPLFEADAVDRHLTASPFVMLEDGAWRMWYVSGTGWRDDGQPCYHIKYAESTDGVHWQRNGLVCIDYEDPSEHAISRPSVIRDADGYRMWFASRGTRYRVRYAESKDGLTWQRQSEPGGVTTSETGWDSGMVAYPHVFDRGSQRMMLYNGNDYGKTGIGLAVTDGPALGRQHHPLGDP